MIYDNIGYDDIQYDMNISGERYDIQCIAVGGRPEPSISWYHGNTVVNGLQTKLEVL